MVVFPRKKSFLEALTQQDAGQQRREALSELAVQLVNEVRPALVRAPRARVVPGAAGCSHDAAAAPRN